MLATKTDDSVLEATPCGNFSKEELVEYLEKSPRHAVVLHGSTPQYILRGAGEWLDNFYWGEYPAEDPNDANGGGLRAKEALADALAEVGN